ncbi:hypothetical protein BDV18DRAFT_161811 [Aspergillus unguis]
MPFGSSMPADFDRLNSSQLLDTSLAGQCLPPAAQAMELFDHFVRCLHPTFGVLHIPTTRALIQQIYLSHSEIDLASVALVYSLFAGAALKWTMGLLQTLHATQEDAKTASSTYIRMALAIIDQRDSIPASTTMLQAISTLSFVLSHADGASQTVHTLRAHLLAMARTMNIHRLDTAKRREERRLNGCSVVETEVLRRIWWHLVASDWLPSLSAGPLEGSYLLQPKHMKVDYPSNVDDEAIPASECHYGYPLSIPTSMTAFLCRIRLAELCREVVDAMPSVFFEYPESSLDEVDYNLILRMDERFETFLNDLPVFFKLDSQSMQQSITICRERPYIAWQRAILHFGINTRICRLHRPFHLAGLTDPRYVYSRMRCIRSAETVLHLRQSMEELGHMDDLNPARFWLVMQHFFSAAIILATDVSMAPTDAEAHGRREEVLAACRMLERSKEESATLKKAIQKNTKTLVSILEGRGVQPNHHHPPPPSRPRSSLNAHTLDFIMNESPPIPRSPRHDDELLRDINMSTPSLLADMQSISPTLGDDGWGKLWEDMFDAGRDLDIPQWSSILDDIEFSC